MIVGTFIILWTPGIISLFIISITGNRDFHIDILELSTILVHLNAAIDPIIYAYRMNNIRDALQKLLTGFKPTTADRNQSSSSSGKRSSRSSRSSQIVTISWHFYILVLDKVIRLKRFMCDDIIEFQTLKSNIFMNRDVCLSNIKESEYKVKN